MKTESKQILEAQLRATLDIIPAYTWYAAASGALTFVNELTANYLGLPKDHPLRFGIDIGGEWDAHIPLLHPDDREESRRIWSICLQTGSARESSIRIRNAEGGYRWFQTRVEPLRASDGTLLYWVGVNLDIEERKQAEFYLEEGQRLAHTGSWVFNPAGFDYWSRELFHIHGLNPAQEAPSLEEYLALVHPEDRDFMASLVKRVVEEASGFDVTKRIIRPNGEVRYIRCVGIPAVENGALQRIVGTAMDVTEHELLTQELRRREAYLTEAQRLSQTGSFVWRPESGEIVWSDQTYRIFEYDRAIKPTRDLLLERVHPEDRADFLRVIDRASAGATDVDHAYRLFLPDGRVKYVHTLAHALQDAAGDREFVGAGIDVTERKRAEEELLRSEIELRQVLDLTPQLVLVFGPNRERLYANRMALDYFGFSLDEWRQRSRGSVVHPNDSERVRASQDRALSTGSPFELELRGRKADGSYRWFLVRFNPVRDEKGQVMRWYAAATDIEDRKRAEEKLQQENAALREEIDQASMFEEIVGTSPALKVVLSHISKVAPSDSTVLITGETGTGKELVARAIHRRSARASRAFVSVNCAAIPRELIASELFGHEKGAFTGATQRRIGRFELADGGTIFLDEVGELLPDTQAALLRVLQEREFERLGGNQPIHVDVRVVTATNRNLEAAVSNGSFRQDLLYRLNVFPIEVPPLRERTDDILMLVEYFVQRYASRAGKNIRSIEKKTLDLLHCYEWPGNIRELQNVIERSVILCSSEVFSVDESWLSKGPRGAASRVQTPAPLKVEAEPRSEREIIEAALAESRGRVSGPSGAAARLGIPPSTLDHRIKVLKIDKTRFKFR